MLEIIPSISSLGSSVVIAALFIWYMRSRDVQALTIQKQLADDSNRALRELTKVIAEFSKESALSRQAMKSICNNPPHP